MNSYDKYQMTKSIIERAYHFGGVVAFWVIGVPMIIACEAIVWIIERIRRNS